MLDARTLRALLTLGVLLIGGCAGGRWPLSSKWAMADGDYADKYGKPYPEGERYRRMAKQMVDARHVAGKIGGYAGAAVQTDPGAAGVEIGAFQYGEGLPWLETRGALSLLWADTAEEVFIGGTLGARVQSPSRIAPFVGLGGYLGITPYFEYVAAESDNVDNDDDGFTDESGERDREFDDFAAVYPEIGIHFWATPRTRITASAAYMITSEGRDQDFWFLGVNVARLKLRSERNWNIERPDDPLPAMSNDDFITPEPVDRLPTP